MSKSSVTKVDAGTRLEVTFSFHPSELATDQRSVVAMHHGILHTREHFRPLIRELNQRGIHVLMIDQQSENSRWRNFIGLGSYEKGLAAAIRTFERGHPGYRVEAYVFHSMGGAIGERMQENPANANLCHPAVLMAPIPVQGAVGIFVRLAMTRTGALLKAIGTFSVLSLASDPRQVQTIFFDRFADQETVETCAAELKHSPFLAYLELTLRFGLRYLSPLKHNGQPALLLTSKSDYIFRYDDEVNEYRETQMFYRQGFTRPDGHPCLTSHKVAGGHDFFFVHPDKVARRVTRFLKRIGFQVFEDPHVLRLLRIDPPESPIRPSHTRPGDTVDVPESDQRQEDDAA